MRRTIRKLYGALIAAGADWRARSKGGFTALLFAAQEGDLESARILVAAGANVNEVTAREPGARRDLTGGACIGTTDRDRTGPDDPLCFVPAQNPSPLVMATASGHEALSLFLLERGADPNAADAYGWTALHHAVPEGWAAMSGFLFRPFHDPVRRPNMPQLVEALLSRGANPNARVTRRFSRLAMFTFRENSPVGGTPFALAAAAGDIRIMRMMLAAGADPGLALEDGTTALMLAAGAKRIIDGAGQERSTEEAAKALEAVQLIASLGADLDAPGPGGQTALHHAASIQADSIIQFLADKGANLNAADRRGLTPYQIAAGVGQRAGASRYESYHGPAPQVGRETSCREDHRHRPLLAYHWVQPRVLPLENAEAPAWPTNVEIVESRVTAGTHVVAVEGRSSSRVRSPASAGPRLLSELARQLRRPPRPTRLVGTAKSMSWSSEPAQPASRRLLRRATEAPLVLVEQNFDIGGIAIMSGGSIHLGARNG